MAFQIRGPNILAFREGVNASNKISDIMKFVVITGPESAGKTTLAKTLSEQLGALYVEEYARLYLRGLERPYDEHDLLAIARGQVNLMQLAATQSQEPYIICDTDLTVMKIWSEVKYGFCHPWIDKTLCEAPADLYLLCRPDIPWADDPLREHPEDRSQLFDRYHTLLSSEQWPFVCIQGQQKQVRIDQAMQAIHAHCL